MSREVTILTGAPTIEIIASMGLVSEGLEMMAQWVKQHRPECLPDDYAIWGDLFPHTDDVTDGELLVELAGRACYHSFGAKAGKKSNREYIEHTQSGEVPHASILYHAKLTFFFAGISRRVSHELIRNYVGSDRDEEGSPSQESTRFTHHYGFFVCPPRYLDGGGDGFGPKHAFFRKAMQRAYDDYLIAIENDVSQFERENGQAPKAIDRKRIYEAASSLLPHQSETSFIWTTNPMAIAKLVRERADSAADLEIQRFAKKLRRVAVNFSPNLFPQPWMKLDG